VVKLSSLTYNQRDEIVMRSVVNFLAPMRSKAQPASATPAATAALA
jgi:hypothetical protein